MSFKERNTLSGLPHQRSAFARYLPPSKPTSTDALGAHSSAMEFSKPDGLLMSHRAGHGEHTNAQKAALQAHGFSTGPTAHPHKRMPRNPTRTSTNVRPHFSSLHIPRTVASHTRYTPNSPFLANSLSLLTNFPFFALHCGTFHFHRPGVSLVFPLPVTTFGAHFCSFPLLSFFSPSPPPSTTSLLQITPTLAAHLLPNVQYHPCPALQRQFRNTKPATSFLGVPHPGSALFHCDLHT